MGQTRAVHACAVEGRNAVPPEKAKRSFGGALLEPWLREQPGVERVHPGHPVHLEILEGAAQVGDRPGIGHEQLRDASLIYFRFARSNPALYQLMFGAEFATGEMIPELRSARELAFGELRSTIAEVLGRDVHSPEVRRAARAAWSYTHGLTSLVIHGVLHIPAGMTEERFLDGTLQGLGHLFHTGAQGSSGAG